MKKILITMNNNTIFFKEKKKLNTEYKNLLNTNVISCNELLFSDEYILENNKIVSSFINELTKVYGIDTIIIDDSSFLLMVLNVIKSNKDIFNLIINDDNPLSFNICEAVVKTNIKNINCFTMQPFMIEYLDKYGIIVESRNELLFMSKFMLQNSLNKLSTIYYKVTLQIDFPMSIQDEEDFIAFAKLNNHLKTIDVTSVSKKDLEFIASILKKNNKKNIKINIHNNITDEDTINYLRDFNKKKRKKYKIYFKLIYSNDYIKENLVKQTNSSILQIWGYIILTIIFFSFTYVFYDNYSSMKKVNNINDSIANIISEHKENDEIKEKDTNNTEIDNNNNKKDIIDSNNIITERKKNEDIEILSDVNPDVVGWIKVNNTNIDYPIVQSSDNKFYLKHNFYLEQDNNGWVFMDFHNSADEINDNTILYAHNRYYSGVMFGTLQNTFRKSWYANKDNQIIRFKNKYDDLEYQVFSIYKTPVTFDYLQTYFENNNKKKFFDMLKERSIYNFGIELTNDDKILTLSTCADEENRYVLHAVLIKK